MPLIFGRTFPANSCRVLYAVELGIHRLNLQDDHEMADADVAHRLFDLGGDGIGTATDYHPRVFDELLPGRFVRLEVEAECARAAMAQLEFEAALGHESRHVAEMRRDVERLRIEVAQMLQVDALRFSVGVGSTTTNCAESRAVRVTSSMPAFSTESQYPSISTFAYLWPMKLR